MALEEQNKITLRCVPGHDGVEGNEQADLAGQDKGRRRGGPLTHGMRIITTRHTRKWAIVGTENMTWKREIGKKFLFHGMVLIIGN